MIRLEDIAEVPNNESIPLLDRTDLQFERGLTEHQKEWRETGVVKLEKFLPDALIDEYCALRAQLKKPGGWSCPTPYMYYKELLNISLYPPLMKILEELICEPMGLHLNLTGWVTTTRAWHQDDYLNPDFVNSHYAAVWMALDDIHPDSGPFQYVPGSHRWPLLKRSKIWEHMKPEEIASPDWPTISERICVPVFEEYIGRTGSRIETYLPKRGDVLIWHGRLCHQGSRAIQPGMERKALISHYSSIHHRPDMTQRATWKGEHLFIHNCQLDARSPPPTM